MSDVRLVSFSGIVHVIMSVHCNILHTVTMLPGVETQQYCTLYFWIADASAIMPSSKATVVHAPPVSKLEMRTMVFSNCSVRYWGAQDMDHQCMAAGME